MRATVSVARCRELVVTSRELAWAGCTRRALRAAVEAGEWIRLQRNRYIRGDVWEQLWPEGRHLAAIVAAHAEMTTGSSVFSHESAAVLHGLPQYRHAFGSLHVTVTRDGAMPSRAGLFRHRDALSAADVVMIDGIRCTSLERTVYDLARTVGAEVALSAADAALRRIAGGPGAEYRVDVAEAWRAGMLSRASESPGARGVRRACEVLDLADGRAESPGESVSRLRWHQAGFRDLVVQPIVSLSTGQRRCDLAIGELRAFFEFDGRVKYLDLDMRGGRSAEQVVVDEKVREDEIRAVTGWRVLRAVDEDIASPASFAAYLARFRIR
jgi:hypothetical protein